MFFTMVYGVFLPLKLGTAWFYGGFCVYVLGTALLCVATLDFATTPVDQPVGKGVYRFSRHPLNFGSFLVFIGTGTACASWLLLPCGMAFSILVHSWLPSEEQWCLEQYGNAYREYMNRTPKWIGLPRSTEQ